MRALAEDAGEKKESVVGNGEALLQTSGAEADQIEEVMGEAVAFAALVGNGEAVFFPGLIEEGEHAVMKEVEEIAKSFIAGAEAREDQSCIEMRKRPLGAGGAHEIDGE